MDMNKRQILFCLILVFVPLFGVVAEDSASETVSSVVGQVRKVIVAEQKTLSPKELDKKLYGIIAPVFDFKTMARSSLAKHWKSTTASEQQEYVNLFSELLAQTYLKRIRENAAESGINVVGEKSRGKDKAIVQTKVTYDKDQTVTIDYRLRQKDGLWLVYDVIIENIGLVSNYRQEFDGIVKKEKVSGLIKKLREKKS